MNKTAFPEGYEKMPDRDKMAWILENYLGDDYDDDGYATICDDAPEEVRKEFERMRDFDKANMKKGVIVD